MALSRDEYKKIKHYSRSELEEYLTTIYQQGYNDGVTTFSKTIADKIDKGVRNARQIGPKRYNYVMDSINKEVTS